MKPNLAIALASQPLLCFTFSGTTGSSSQYLPSAGGVAGDGLPLPLDGTLVSITVFDGSDIYSDIGDVTFAAHDRLSVYCQNDGGVFTVRVRLNGVSTSLRAESVPLSSTLQVTVVVAVNRF